MVNPLCDLELDSLDGFLKLLRVIVLRNVEVDAVAAISAFNVDGSHVFLEVRVVDLCHASVLPRILASSCKHNIASSNIEATKVLVCLSDSRWLDVFREDSLAVVEPEIGLNRQSLRTHSIDGVGSLEPGKLSAILVGPLSNVLVDVNLGASELNCIVLINTDSLVISVPSESGNRIIIPIIRFNSRTHACSFSILDSHGEDIGDVEHEIAIHDVHIGVVELLEHLSLESIVSRLEDPVNLVSNVANTSRAFIA